MNNPLLRAGLTSGQLKRKSGAQRLRIEEPMSTNESYVKRSAESDIMKSSAEGNALSEANYLDTHYEAAKEAYEASVRYVGFQKGWSILDAGAGGGSFIPIISELLGTDGKITALDLDAENIATIKRRQAAGEFDCPVETYVGGVTDLPFDDNSFDAIWCSAVIQYLSDDEVATMLVEFRRVVRSGGLIVVKDYDESGTVLGDDMLRSRRSYQGIKDVPDFKELAIGQRRIIKLPTLFTQHSIEFLRYKSFVADHRFPVTPSERPFLESVVPMIGWLISQCELPEEDVQYWKRWANPEADDYILDSPEFYFREGHGIAIGRKPL